MGVRPTIKLRDAIQQMRKLSSAGVPFSFTFISYSEQLQKSDGLKGVENALLRTGYRQDQSDKHNLLIAYKSFNGSQEGDRQFYLPLLMTFNQYIIQP